MDNVFLLVLSLLPAVVTKKHKQLSAAITITLLTIVYGSVAVCSLLESAMPVQWLEQFRISPIASIFALLFCASTLPVILSERANPNKSSLHYSIFYGSIIALFVSLFGVLHSLSSPHTTGDIIWNVAFNWEVMGLTSFMMLLLKASRREYFHSAILYFIVMHVGFFFLLAGFISLGSEEGFVFGHIQIETTTWILLLVGFGFKSAIYPLYFWLPYTYRASLGAGAAIMAGTATNIGIFGIISITYLAMDIHSTSYILVVLGLISALTCSLSMIRSGTISRILSLSSIENMGAIIFGVGFSFLARFYGATDIAALIMVAAMVKLFTHGITKAALLTIGGKVRRLSSTETISQLGGIIRKLPGGSRIFALGGMSLSGMPLMGSFVAEFLYFTTLLMALKIPELSIVAIIGVIVMALSSASTIFNITKTFTVAFLGSARSEFTNRIKEESTTMKKIGYALFTLFILSGGWLIAYLLMSNVNTIFSFSNIDTTHYWSMLTGIAIISGALLLTVILLWWIRARLEKSRQSTIDDTWGCGNPLVNQGGTEPSAESFSYEAGVIITLPGEGRATKIIKKRVSPARILRRWTFRLAWFQTGRISHYVLHIIWFLALVLILTLCDAL